MAADYKYTDCNIRGERDMKLIVAVDKNWGIGRKNELLVHIPNDMKFFRNETMGKVIIMGRKTLESFPQGQPLGGRTNIVLTSDESYSVKGAVIVHSVEEAITESEKHGSEVYCIGGASVYEQLLPYCDTAYVTRIDYGYEADTFFPNLDDSPEWKMTAASDEQTYFDIEYRFTTYERV